MSNPDALGRERLLWLLSGATFLIFFQPFMVAPLLPRLAELFDVSVEAIGLIVPAYLLPYGAATLVYGPLSDRFGRERVILASLLAFVVLTALTAMAWSPSSLLVVRLLTGLGASGVVPIALALLGDLFPFHERGRPLGWLFGAMAGGMAFGSTAGVMLEPVVGWRGLILGVALLVLFVLALLVPHRALLGPQHVQAMLNEKLAAGLSPRTVQYIRAILRRSLGQALKWGLVARNVATLVDPPKTGRAEVRPLTPEQARHFLNTIQGDRLEALYSVAVALGLRQGEALGLQWEDIDFSASTLRVRRALQRVDGTLRFVEPKTERSRRTVDIPAPTLAGLVAHRDRQAFERAFAGDRWQEWDLVFTTAKGTPLDGTAVTKRLQRLLADADLPRQRFHDLRHCCASLLLAQSVPPRVVMEILGHSQISLTMNTYSHVMPTARREAADLMGAILGPGGLPSATTG